MTNIKPGQITVDVVGGNECVGFNATSEAYT